MYLDQDLSAGNWHLLGTSSDWFGGHVGGWDVSAYLECPDLRREERLRLQAWYRSTFNLKSAASQSTTQRG
jgi:hypothetical protein